MNERERLEFLMRCHNLTPSLFADKVGIQRASVSHILSGRNKISLDIVVKINRVFPDASFEWLINGTGAAPKGVDVQKEEPELPMLFDTPSVAVETIVEEPKRAAVVQQKSQQQQKSVVAQPKQQRRVLNVRNIQPANDRYIKEIRIFYSDGTYETLFPEK